MRTILIFHLTKFSKNALIIEMKTLTIKDIAKIANISTATISRIINNSSLVKKETRERVMKIIRKHNFSPNIAAKNLVKRQTKNIGLLFPYNEDMLSDLYLTEIAANIEKTVAESGYDFTLYFHHKDIDMALGQYYLDFFLSGKICGLIIGGVQINDRSLEALIKYKKPIVVIGSTLRNYNVNYVDANHKDAVKKAIRYFIKQNKKRIVYMGSSLMFSACVDKFSGYKEALRDHNIKLNNDYVFHNVLNYEQAYKICESIIRNDKLPEAIFCDQDILAWGVINCMLDNRIKSPDQIPVVGYNNIKISKYIYPFLSTIKLPIESMAKAAVDILIDDIKNPEKKEQKKVFDAELVIRNSG